MLALSLSGLAAAQDMRQPYVRVAEIEIDPAQLENYKVAVKEKIEASIRSEPGVLALYAVYDRQNSANIRVFEIYASENAYRTHLETPHFKKYKAVTSGIVKSLSLLETVPIMLGSK